MLIVPLLVTLVLTLMNAAVAEAERWQPPLRDAQITREFDFDPAAPFARGQRRGVKLGAAPGALVRAPCGGRVTFAGRHPRLGDAITLRCGRLVATTLGLEHSLVGKGDTVPAGGPLGRLAANGLLHLGARVATRRSGYLDPLTLIGPTVPPPPLAPPPHRVLPRTTVPPAPRVSSPGRTSSAPPLAWLGAALAGIGAGLGTTLRTRRRTSRDGDAWPRTEWSAIRRRP